MEYGDIKIGDFLLIDPTDLSFIVHNEAYRVINKSDKRVWLLDHHTTSGLTKAGRSVVLEHHIPAKYIGHRYAILAQSKIVRKVMPTCPLARKAKEYEESLK